MNSSDFGNLFNVRDSVMDKKMDDRIAFIYYIIKMSMLNRIQLLKKKIRIIKT